ncbi:hypothetical protein A5692_18095 [Mycobacterium sp. E342]|nr:hypothetical protein A5692_18095 [Mycobacterium sp. E342]
MATTPGVVNKKLSVPKNSTTASALPAADARGHTGRNAMSSAAPISIVPSPRATVVALNTSYIQLISGLCSMSTRASIFTYFPKPIHANTTTRP